MSFNQSFGRDEATKKSMMNLLDELKFVVKKKETKHVMLMYHSNPSEMLLVEMKDNFEDINVK